MTTKAVLTLKQGGVIEIALDATAAPLTVANFVKLAKAGFYDGLIFHRVIPGFMIQGGCPEGSGTGGPGYQIKGEFTKNGVQNPLRHTRGTISMARSASPDSAGSQFFLMHKDSPHLDGQYAAFGKVISGLDILDRIAAVRTGANDRPVEEQKIASIVIVEEE
jgi:peptidyl-prolyl cis-trans isomerase B (cyclophilin B)